MAAVRIVPNVLSMESGRLDVWLGMSHFGLPYGLP